MASFDDWARFMEWRLKHKRGITREVFLIGKWAIKLPSVRSWRLFLQGLLGNMQEKELSGFDDRLCPVVFSIWGGWVSIMPRCGSLPEFTDEMGGICEYMGFIEKKLCSFGLLDGKLVAVDYGSGR